ncbi:MAG: hypothetical protein FJ280_10115 [Planctomycetes bacterium]|nr:hypothetical protein [Planctomycetota bacterium]
MREREHENLVGLFQRFLEEPAARAAHEDIEAGERWLAACPAPLPDARVVAAIKAQTAALARRRHRTAQWGRAAVATAAAIVLAWVGLFGPRSADRPGISYAAILPAAIWESDDLAADDLDIVYFTAEIRHLEATLRAVDAGEIGLGGGLRDELENELMAIEAEFWKG